MPRDVSGYLLDGDVSLLEVQIARLTFGVFDIFVASCCFCMVCLDNEDRPRKLLFGSGSLEPMDIGPQMYGQWKLEKCCGSDICCDMCALAEETGSIWILSQTWNKLWPKKVCGMTQSSNFLPRCFLSYMPCACRKRWFNTLKEIPEAPRREYKLSYSYWALNGGSTA